MAQNGELNASIASVRVWQSLEAFGEQSCNTPFPISTRNESLLVIQSQLVSTEPQLPLSLGWIIRVLAIMAGLYLVDLIWGHWMCDRGQARRLGSKPRIAPYWMPFGFDLAFRMARDLYSFNFLNFTQKNLDVPGRTVQLNLLTAPVLLTDSTENIKAILSTQFADFGKSTIFQNVWENILGFSVFNSEGTVWKDHSRFLRPLLAKTRPSDLVTIENHVSSLLEALSHEKPINILDTMQLYTLNCVTDVFFGESAQSIQSDQKPFLNAVNILAEWNTVKTAFGPLGQYFPDMNTNRSLEAVRLNVNGYVKKTNAISPASVTMKPERDRTVLEALALNKPTAKNVKDQVMPIIMAGKDPIAITLAWALYELSHNPAVTQQLRSEIATKIGFSTPPTKKELKEMRVLNNIVREIHRLYHPVGYNVRTALIDTSLPRGGGVDGLGPVAVFAGQQVIYALLNMQRRRDLFGDDAEVFRPDRWDNWKPEIWEYLPFSNGPRICQGRHFARLHIEYTLVRIFQKFESITGGQGRQRIKVELNPKPAYPIMCNLHRSSSI